MGYTDGASTRRERILDMLTYISGFTAGGGVSVNQVQAYMSMAHGLTPKKVAEYIYEVKLGGMIQINGGLALIRAQNFKRLIELVAPNRDPATGLVKQWDGEDFDNVKPKRTRVKKEINEALDAHSDKNKTSPGGPDK